ncbi:MAG: hypothetical protein EB119_08890 [Synechococcaceae bacterium WBB_34_004]|nr:hypothetical protein [Pseudomonadota bacterium]NDG03288.1 hypothetical protein [Synechococcaceae bacterium WBB_34_004]
MAMFNFDFSPQAQLQAELAKVRLENEKVRMEAYRRTMNAAAAQEGKAMALRDNLTQTAKDIEAAEMDAQRTQRQWFEARQRGQLSPEQNQLYRDAYANAQANVETQKSKYRVLTMERGHMDGSLDKTIAKTSEPMFSKIFDPKKDPYDQIEEERRSKTTDQTTGTETEVVQKGPASAFGGGNAYSPQGEEDKFTAPSTVTGLFGYTPRGFEPEPDISYRPVKNQGGVTSESDVAGATEVDPTSTQPNPNPVASMTPKSVSQPVKTGGFVRVRNKATGETGTIPAGSREAALATGNYEEIP